MNHLLNFLKGVCMGAADVVPGVSGGTVALVTGIYERLIGAISRFDSRLLSLLRHRQWRDAMDHIDWKFLLALGTGLVCGFIVTVKTLAHYLEDDATRTLVLAAFFGMIVAATIIVAGLVRRKTERRADINWFMAAAGLAIALTIYFVKPVEGGAGGEPSLVYLYVCGMIAICAMILPGISGALLLILLGVYEPLVMRIKAFLKLEDLAENFMVCLCFGFGAITGLAVFSRVLKMLLEKYTAATLSLLCGLMVGSLPLLWPFQVNTTPGVEELKERIYRPVWPEALDGHFWKHVGVALVAVVAVMVADAVGSRLAHQRREREVAS